VALIEWSAELSTGIEEVDNQHQRLVDIINELHIAMLDRREKQVMSKIFTELVNYTKTHFAFEEELFERHGYPAEEAHKLQHQQLAQKVIDLKEEFDAGNTAVTLEVMRFLRDWLADHIIGSDKRYAPFLIEKGV
jgi:hemerythrin-like metal-binding protein